MTQALLGPAEHLRQESITVADASLHTAGRSFVV